MYFCCQGPQGLPETYPKNPSLQRAARSLQLLNLKQASTPCSKSIPS